MEPISSFCLRSSRNRSLTLGPPSRNSVKSPSLGVLRAGVTTPFGVNTGMSDVDDALGRSRLLVIGTRWNWQKELCTEYQLCNEWQRRWWWNIGDVVHELSWIGIKMGTFVTNGLRKRPFSTSQTHPCSRSISISFFVIRPGAAYNCLRHPRSSNILQASLRPFP